MIDPARTYLDSLRRYGLAKSDLHGVVFEPDAMAKTMLAGMLLMTFAAWSWCIAAALWRVCAIVVERERGASWLAPDPALKGVT